mgnify:CR=1 FL=1|jgi:hypothetical protein
MIYTNSDTNTVQIPKHIRYEAENLHPISLRLENNVTHEIFEFPNLSNKSKHPNLYEFDLMINVPVGEYEYMIMIDNEKVETGLWVFGDYKKETHSYKSDKNTIQYKR